MARSVLRASVAALPIVLVAFLMPPPAGAEIYKWIDDTGVVNYSEHPPAGGKVRVVAPDQAPVTVYPAPAPGKGVPSREAALDARVGELERQLARERQERERSAALAAERETERIERCRIERRVDCAEDPLDLGYPTVVIHRRPWWQHQRPPLRPHPSKPPREPEPRPSRMLRMPPPR